MIRPLTTQNILAIESSCDETAVALLRGEGDAAQLVADRIASQIDLHARFGGVVPELASRAHMRILPTMVREVMDSAGWVWDDLDAVAVTAGPGLMGALLVGVSFARGLAAAKKIPLLPIHHLEGHLLAAGLDGALPPFPFVSLLVSGGNTLLVRVDGVGHYRLLGQTLDDAAGECFDKCARALGLAYPGGPAIAKAAQRGDGRRFALPRPMLRKPNLNFSFSGLKTAVAYLLRDQPELRNDPQGVADVAAGVEVAIAEVLAVKALAACREHGCRALVIAGGVAANHRLRQELARRCHVVGVGLHLPQGHHCTDNAAMIAYAAWHRLRLGLPIPPRDSWDARARWPIEELTIDD
ncbi:MAG: tRNA (adenosine(37)-N6)-threonylcarbamoyltransferase complex transferase subunit TsaD [Mariprofundales bacterium]|nr:tRNA (adenosine(37)-N6)-threonylcarbamoyltransferase complex transferase subunit TsaD [Mariprofundales bacterium]